MKKITFIIMLMLVSQTHVFADQESHRAAVLRFLEITNTQKILDQMTQSYKAIMTRYISSLNLPTEAAEDIEIMEKEIVEMIKSYWSWEKMQDIYVDVFIDAYTEDEIKELTAFYESPLGKKVVVKTPELMQKSVQISQSLMQEKLPEFQEAINKKASELQSKYNKTN